MTDSSAPGNRISVSHASADCASILVRVIMELSDCMP
eukprot:CAMPEP_0181239664 /NCGR_PEP_ID=MMETSP1096-20121128/40072_1 /TAXON_ID=156174 ORGANISM="Chrysochromulina ericina, Strain CCMP281" /NCGR_SAMPLE_ID=MMETSP1096 /ASSEMBLY_ACC=CAM_ASM_000453 /LENGTH=36 /DNA_ID= /DNA_START= /DNA_END= /DNA_ORIENTATION=